MKKNAVYEIRPEDMQKIIDVDSSKPGNNLKTWPEWVEFVKSWSRSYQFQKGLKPTPLTANLVAETPPTEAESEAQETMKYSTEQWIAWLQEDEETYHVAQGFPTARRQRCSVLRGPKG